MSSTPINDVLAANLRFFMDQGEYRTQATLAQRSGLAQRTIGNYLSPRLRLEGSTGKQPSAKLSELEKIANSARYRGLGAVAPDVGKRPCHLAIRCLTR